MKPAFFILILACILQLAVPAFLIIREERTLHEGQVYKFKTQPVDPYDAYRGRYVSLSYAESKAANPTKRKFATGEAVYVTLETDAEGYAKPREIFAQKPADQPSVKVIVRYGYGNLDLVEINYPFDRYYMEESKAPKAEQAYRKANLRTFSVADPNHANAPAAHNSYVTVRILNGHPALEELYLDGLPMNEYLQQHPEK